MGYPPTGLFSNREWTITFALIYILAVANWRTFRKNESPGPRNASGTKENRHETQTPDSLHDLPRHSVHSLCRHASFDQRPSHHRDFSRSQLSRSAVHRAGWNESDLSSGAS